MGCDIHMYVEVFKNDKWICADYFKKNQYYSEKDNDGERPFEIVHIYDDRNYELFGILAGVRNSNVKPISLPRGLPIDINEEIVLENERWGCDGHSHSYLTLKELIDNSEKYKTIKRYGYITKEQYNLYSKENIKPNCWCGDVFPKDNYEWVEWEDEHCGLFELIHKLKERTTEFLWVWDDKIYENSSKIRIVFWFDN